MCQGHIVFCVEKIGGGGMETVYKHDNFSYLDLLEFVNRPCLIVKIHKNIYNSFN